MLKKEPAEVFCMKRCSSNISQNSQECNYVEVSFLIKLHASGLHFIKKETSTQLLSCAFCQTFKNTFLYRTPPVAASAPFNSIASFIHKISKYKICRI